jgi:hypothetical protein
MLNAPYWRVTSSPFPLLQALPFNENLEALVRSSQGQTQGAGGLAFAIAGVTLDKALA